MPSVQRRPGVGSQSCSNGVLAVQDDWFDAGTGQGPVSLILPIFLILSVAMAQFCVLCGLSYILLVATAMPHTTSAVSVAERCNATLARAVSAGSMCARHDVDINVH